MRVLLFISALLLVLASGSVWAYPLTADDLQTQDSLEALQPQMDEAMLPDGTMVSLDTGTVSPTCATCGGSHHSGGSHHRPPCDHDCRPVPAPMTAILVGLGLGGVVGWRRLKGRK